MLKGFICPEGGEQPGRKNKISYCVRHCSMPCASPNMLVAMLQREEQNPHTGKMISVSQISGGCKRKGFLDRTLDYYLVPDKALPAFRGALIHLLIEQTKVGKRLKSAKCLVEEHLELLVKTLSGEWTLSATLDFYDANRATIFDVKTLGNYAVKKLVTGQEKGTWSDHISDSYVKQLNLYGYILRKVKGLPVEHLRLQIIDFGRLILTGTRVEFGDWKTKKTYDIPDIPILPDEVIESWINSDGDEWYKILFLDGPTKVVEEKYKWLCKWCSWNGSEHCPSPDLERAQQFEV